MNGLFWVGFFALAQLRPAPAIDALIPALIFFSLPATALLLPLPGSGANMTSVVLYCVIVGINAGLWGHGLAWLIQRFRYASGTAALLGEKSATP